MCLTLKRTILVFIDLKHLTTLNEPPYNNLVLSINQWDIIKKERKKERKKEQLICTVHLTVCYYHNNIQSKNNC